MKTAVIKSGKFKGKSALFLEMSEIMNGNQLDESLLSSVSDRFSRIKVRESDDNFVFIFGEDPFRYQGVSRFEEFLRGLADLKFKIFAVTPGNVWPQTSFAKCFTYLEIHPDYGRIRHFYERGVLNSYGKFNSYAVFRFNHGDQKEVVAKFIQDFDLNGMEKYIILSNKFTYTQMDIAKYMVSEGIRNVNYQFEA